MSMETYLALGQAQPGTVESQMFGKPCFKVNGKAFVCYFQDCMVFKLNGEEHRDALALEGSVLFDPSGKGRAMKEWVQVTAAHAGVWARLTAAAHAYVLSQA